MATTSKEYRGFRYVSIGGKSWKIYYPNGHKFQRQFKDEDEVKQAIDEILSSFGEEANT